MNPLFYSKYILRCSLNAVLLLLILSHLVFGINSKDKKMTDLELATFAGGCFWCMEPPFEKLEGVSSAVSGYMGGKKDKPTYEQVSMGTTGHAEVVQVSFNPKVVSYTTLLEIFLMNIDPTDPYGQFADKGSQYRTEIFYHNSEQKKLAEEALKILAHKKIFDKPIAVRISAASSFFPAEEYHQDYYKKNPGHYTRYKIGSGRDGFIKSKWDKQKLNLEE
jgi:peptide methionine sulfoxide reductase msrA/msrB